MAMEVKAYIFIYIPYVSCLEDNTKKLPPHYVCLAGIKFINEAHTVDSFFFFFFLFLNFPPHITAWSLAFLQDREQCVSMTT